MIHSHPPPLPPPRNPPHPQLLPQLLPHPQLPEFPPPQQHSRRRIQIQLPNPLPLPHPHPLLAEHPQESLHPQFVAVKSLIFLSLHRFIYALFYAGRHVNVSREMTVIFEEFIRRFGHSLPGYCSWLGSQLAVTVQTGC